MKPLETAKLGAVIILALLMALAVELIMGPLPFR